MTTSHSRRRVRPQLSLLESRCQPSFVAGVNVDTSLNPWETTTGDFNGDGHIDLAVGKVSGKTLIFLNDGSGGFQEFSNFDTGKRPYEAKNGDFNNDGVVDLLFAYDWSGSSGIFVSIGNGDGTFQPPLYTHVASSYARSVDIGDLDSDGDLDALYSAGGLSTSTTRVLLGNGNGTFQVGGVYATTGLPGNVVITDLNNDGERDGVVDWTANNDNRGGIDVLIGNGNGTFQSPQSIKTGEGTSGTIAGDFNDDGNQDVAVTLWQDFVMKVLLGNGNGTFQSPVSYSTGRYPNGSAIADFNGDGSLDVAVGNGYDWTLSVLQNNGDGTFQPPLVYAAGKSPKDVDIGDFNSDGRPDAVVTNGNGGNVTILLTLANGQFPTPNLYTIGKGTNAIASGDLNGDGYADVAATSGSDSNVAILLNNGSGSLAAPKTVFMGVAPSDIGAGDFTGDGKLDLITTNSISKTVSLFRGKGDGTFRRPIFWSFPYAFGSLVVEDFDADGKLDLALTSSNAGVAVLLGNGNGTFGLGGGSAAGSNATNMDVGDFNGDGIVDIAVVNSSQNDYVVHVLIGAGDGSFTPIVSNVGGNDLRGITTGDFNKDGRLDVAVGSYWYGRICVALGNGDGTLQPATLYGGLDKPVTLDSTDLNGDGAADIVAGNEGTFDVRVLLADGVGGFHPVAAYAIGANATDMVLVDMNQDGGLDVAVASYGVDQEYVGKVAVLFNANDWVPVPIPTLPPVPDRIVPLDEERPLSQTSQRSSARGETIIADYQEPILAMKQSKETGSRKLAQARQGQNAPEPGHPATLLVALESAHELLPHAFR